MRIGIFGGSFNPCHNMHKKIAIELIEKGYVDKVIYVPTGDKYNKDGLISVKDRYKMLSIMVQDNSNLYVSDYEVTNELTYTYETLSHFKKKYPNDIIYFICGSDNILEIDTWNNYKYILESYKILVIKRNDDDINEILENNRNIVETDIAMSNLSSTKIRELIKINKREELITKMDKNVLEYIEKNNLYKE